MDDLNSDELPIFLDVHKLPFSEDHLKEFFKSPIDEFGVRHVNYFYDKGANMFFPNHSFIHYRFTRFFKPCGSLH